MPDPTLKTLSATQSAALFDVSPYTTRWLLWRVFSGLDTLEDLDEEENERMLWGNLHEPTVFYETLRRLNLEGRYNEDQDYVRHPSLPIGCTPDGEVWHPSKGKAVVQVKCTDWLIWKNDWTDELPPPQIVHQVQHEMLVMDAAWAVIPCLINGNELRLYEMYPDAEFQAEIVARTEQFFKDVKEGNEPDPLGVEMEVPALLKREYKPKEVVDLTGSEEAYNAIQALRHWEPLASSAKKGVDQAKAKLLALSGGAGIIKAHGYGCEIKLNPTKESAIELPPELRSKLEEVETYLTRRGDSHDMVLDSSDVIEAVTETLEWRAVTRKAGFMKKYSTWEEEAEGTPSWIEPFDTDIVGA